MFHKTNIDSFLKENGELNITDDWQKIENNKFVFQNLETGLNDYIKYIVPIALLLGSSIVMKKKKLIQ